MLSTVMPTIDMLRDVVLSVVRLSVDILNVVALKIRLTNSHTGLTITRDILYKSTLRKI
jgi:hypothetical protein